MVATRFKTFGAGVPSGGEFHGAEVHTTIEEGWVVMTGLNRRIDPLSIRTSEVTDHRLLIDDREIPLPTGGYRFEITPSRGEWKDR